jgi:hypothetical protein
LRWTLKNIFVHYKWQVAVSFDHYFSKFFWFSFVTVSSHPTQNASLTSDDACAVRAISPASSLLLPCLHWLTVSSVSQKSWKTKPLQVPELGSPMEKVVRFRSLLLRISQDPRISSFDKRYFTLLLKTLGKEGPPHGPQNGAQTDAHFQSLQGPQ